MRIRLAHAFVVLAASLPAQDAPCPKCQGTGRLEPCSLHAALRKPMVDLGMQLGWGAKEPCCNLTGARECPDCAKKKPKYDENDPSLSHHLNHEWTQGEKSSSIGVRALAHVIRQLGDNYLTACTNHFFLVTNPSTPTLSKAQYKAFEPEIEAAKTLLPGLLKTQSPTISREDTTILYLLRCENLYRSYWQMLGREEGPDFFLYHKGYEAEGLFVPLTHRRIEAFILHGDDSREAFEVYHNGNGRMWGIPERFTATVSGGDDFSRHPLPADQQAHAILAYRIGAALTSRFLVFQNKSFTGSVPFFLEVGTAHALAIQATGKAVYRGGNSEDQGDDGTEWQSDDWQQRMGRLVGVVRRKDGSSNAPTFDQMTAVKNETATFSHHLAAWSLVTFLRLLPDGGKEKLLQFMLAMREGADAAAALNKVYGVSGRELTDAWHGWARDNQKQILAPAAGLKGEGPQTVMANYKKVMVEKTARNKDKADLSQRRLGVIRSLRWGPPKEAATALVELLRSKEIDDEEALAAMQTLRRPELRGAEVASVLNTELQKAVNKTGEERFQIRMLRATGRQVDHRKQLLPILHRYLQSAEIPAEVAAAAAHSLGELRDPDSLTPIRGAARSPNALLRAEAASALADLGPENDLELASSLLQDNSWHVRIAAIEIFEKLRTPEAGDRLIARLPLENGRLLEDIENALMSMTRLKTRFASAEEWKDYWTNKGGRDSVVAGAPQPKKSPSTVVAGGDGAGFPPIRSKRFMFMVDVSISMNQPVTLKPKPGGTRVSGTDVTKPKIRFIGEKLAELIQDPKQIPVDVVFDIAFFAAQTDSWKGKLVPAAAADSENRTSAVRFVMSEGRAQEARTDLRRALESALKMAQESLMKAERESAIDTIYLLTDGSPTAGKTLDPDVLCEWFREENRNHRIKVYVITIGATDTDMPFLERLAGENYGPPPVVVLKEG